MLGDKNYYRIMLGGKSVFAKECYEGNFIGTDFGIDIDLTDKLPDNWREFNRNLIPYYLQKRPDKSKVTAGLACGATYTVAKGLQIGDIVLCPDGNGHYLIGEIASAYFYYAGEILPHRRSVKWYPQSIARADMSQGLKNSTGSIGTVSNITKYADEIKNFITDNVPSELAVTDKTVEDPSVFELEKHLEDFMVHNWSQTSLGQNYDIYEVDGELIGQQYPCDTGRIDILAISKDKKTLLVVELKRGRASDVVVGQTQRYMGYVLEELLEEGQTVRGVIIASEDDKRIRMALRVAPNIDFYRYEVSFKLFKS